MYLTDEQWNSDTCPVEGALNFNADCPNAEDECLIEYMGANVNASQTNVFQYYRLYVTENFGERDFHPASALCSLLSLLSPSCDVVHFHRFPAR